MLLIHTGLLLFCSAGRLLGRLLRCCFCPWQVKTLPSLPQAFSANTELLGQFGLTHRFLMFEHKALEIVLQGELSVAVDLFVLMFSR